MACRAPLHRSAVALLALAAVALLAGACRRKAQVALAEGGWPARVRALPVEKTVAELAAARGRPVLLVVWAAWCTSCRAELPDVAALGRRHEGRGLKVAAWSTDEEPADLVELLAEVDVPVELVRIVPGDPGAVAQALAPLGARGFRGSIPYAVLIDRAGKVVNEWTGRQSAATFEAALEKVL